MPEMVALRTFTVVLNGAAVQVSAGDRLAADVPVVRVRPDLFADAADEPDGAAVAHDEEND